MLDTKILEIYDAEIGYAHSLINIPYAKLVAGEITLLIGDNGVGKTTLLKTILGQIPPIKGRIFVDKTDISKLSAKEIALKTAVVFSKTKIPANYTVLDLVSLGKFAKYPYYFRLTKKDRLKIEEIIEKLQLVSYKNTLLSHLSDGILQKAFIAMALAKDTPIILLDEPTTHLDQKNKIIILQFLKEIAQDYNKAILFSSHDWHLAKQYTDNIWLLDKGDLYAGFSEEVQWQRKDFFTKNVSQFSSEFIPPTILGSNYDIELITSILQKNFKTDLSSLTFCISENNEIKIITKKQDEYIVKSLYQTIETLKNIGF